LPHSIAEHLLRDSKISAESGKGGSRLFQFGRSRALLCPTVFVSQRMAFKPVVPDRWFRHLYPRKPSALERPQRLHGEPGSLAGTLT
jgi:hypothetical protein